MNSNKFDILKQQNNYIIDNNHNNYIRNKNYIHNKETYNEFLNTSNDNLNLSTCTSNILNNINDTINNYTNHCLCNTNLYTNKTNTYSSNNINTYFAEHIINDNYNRQININNVINYINNNNNDNNNVNLNTIIKLLEKKGYTIIKNNSNSNNKLNNNINRKTNNNSNSNRKTNNNSNSKINNTDTLNNSNNKFNNNSNRKTNNSNSKINNTDTLNNSNSNIIKNIYFESLKANNVLHYKIFNCFEKYINNKLNNKKLCIKEKQKQQDILNLLNNIRKLKLCYFKNSNNNNFYVTIKTDIECLSYHNIKLKLPEYKIDNYIVIEYYNSLVKLFINSLCNCDKKEIKLHFYSKNIYSVFIKSKLEFFINLNKNVSDFTIILNNILNLKINKKQLQRIIKELFD